MVRAGSTAVFTLASGRRTAFGISRHPAVHCSIRYGTLHSCKNDRTGLSGNILAVSDSEQSHDSLYAGHTICIVGACTDRAGDFCVDIPVFCPEFLCTSAKQAGTICRSKIRNIEYPVSAGMLPFGGGFGGSIDRLVFLKLAGCGSGVNDALCLAFVWTILDI